MGSNVFNIGIVVGILATIGSLKKFSTDLLGELVDILFLSSLIPIVLVMFGSASFLVGLALVSVFAFSIYRITKNGKQRVSTTNDQTETMQPSKKGVVLKIAIGITLVIVACPTHHILCI